MRRPLVFVMQQAKESASISSIVAIYVTGSDRTNTVYVCSLSVSNKERKVCLQGKTVQIRGGKKESTFTDESKCVYPCEV